MWLIPLPPPPGEMLKLQKPPFVREGAMEDILLDVVNDVEATVLALQVGEGRVPG